MIKAQSETCFPLCHNYCDTPLIRVACDRDVARRARFFYWIMFFAWQITWRLIATKGREIRARECISDANRPRVVTKDGGLIPEYADRDELSAFSLFLA